MPAEDQIKQLVKNRLPLANVTRGRRKLLREISEVAAISTLLELLHKEEQKLAALHKALDIAE